MFKLQTHTYRIFKICLCPDFISGKIPVKNAKERTVNSKCCFIFFQPDKDYFLTKVQLGSSEPSSSLGLVRGSSFQPAQSSCNKSPAKSIQGESSTLDIRSPSVSQQTPHLPSLISEHPSLPSLGIPLFLLSPPNNFHPLSPSPCTLAINPSLSLMYSELSKMSLPHGNSLATYCNSSQ